MTDAATKDEAAPRALLPTVAIVITAYNDEAFLREALESAFGQTRAADEIVIVDDGSETPVAEFLKGVGGVRVVRQANAGLSSARNAGARAVSADLVIFLDADDRLRPEAVAAGAEAMMANPTADLAYGAHLRVRADCSVIGGIQFIPLEEDAYSALLRRNIIGMFGSAIVRRSALLEVGGFDVSLPRCEDYDLYLRLARRGGIVSHAAVVAEYRWHGRNMSWSPGPMLQAALTILDRQPVRNAAERRARTEGRTIWRWYYRAEGRAAKLEGDARHMIEWLPPAERWRRRRVRWGRRLGKAARRLSSQLTRRWPPPIGVVDLGDLKSTTPVSPNFGFERGTPVDRYYIERFLESHSADVRGRVLEIGEATYSRRFGGPRISRQDVLHVSDGHPEATISGRVEEGALPPDTWDCIIFTQTLHLIFDVQAAMSGLYAALRPGGVLLLTAPGLSQIDRHEWREQWYWAITPVALHRLASGLHGARYEVCSFGNVYASVAFLHGIAFEELDLNKLEENDLHFPVTSALWLQKPA